MLNNDESDEEIEDFSNITEFKKNVHDEVFILSYRGNGGWPWHISYTMPIHLRKFYIKQIQDILEKENRKDKPEQSSIPKIQVPKILSNKPTTFKSK